MKPATTLPRAFLLLICAPLIAGCAKKEPAETSGPKQLDTTRPLSEVRAEAEKMDAAQLRALALEYSQAFKAKTAEGEKLAAELIKLAMTDAAAEKTEAINDKVAAEKTNAIKDKVAAVNAEANALGERLKIYLETLKAKGGDTSGLEM